MNDFIYTYMHGICFALKRDSSIGLTVEQNKWRTNKDMYKNTGIQ